MATNKDDAWVLQQRQILPFFLPIDRFELICGESTDFHRSDPMVGRKLLEIRPYQVFGIFE